MFKRRGHCMIRGNQQKNVHLYIAIILIIHTYISFYIKYIGAFIYSEILLVKAFLLMKSFS